MTTATIIARDKKDNKVEVGTIYWSQEEGSWSFDTNDERARKELEQVQVINAVPYRGSVEEDNTIYEIGSDVTPEDDMFLIALRAYLIKNAKRIYTVRINDTDEKITASKAMLDKAVSL